jgi:putative heme iron utilization protein
MSPTRAAAIHECGVLAGRYAETTYGNTEFYLYRSCMARHGQAE